MYESIVSIDVGYKNLSFVELDLVRTTCNDAPTHTGQAEGAKEETLVVKVSRWTVSSLNTPSSYHPGQFAAYLHRFLSLHDLLTVPRHFLIERQRHRTSSPTPFLKHAINENIFKVLAIEAQLHAFLGAKAESICPRHVSKWWGLDTGQRKKRDAINVVKSLVTGQQPKEHENIQRANMNLFALTFDQATMSKDAHASRTFTLHRLPRTKPSPANVVIKQKMDDLADCMLQGLAYLAWHWQVQKIQLEE